MTTLNSDDFWRFSLAVYANTHTQLLAWQNNDGLNVNLCLFLCYLDTQQLALNHAQLKQLQNAILALDEHALHPLRKVRTFAKAHLQQHPNYSELRQQLLEAELTLEKHQQASLVQCVQRLTLTPSATPNNLVLYLPPRCLPIETDLDQLLHQQP